MPDSLLTKSAVKWDLDGLKPRPFKMKIKLDFSAGG
jgi:hypothetical protein